MDQVSQKKMTHYKRLDTYSLKESVDIHTLLFSLGFKITSENSRDIRAACPIHGGDNKTAFKLNKETRSWVCYTHKCHETYGYDFIGLIKGAKKLEFIEALEHLKNLAGDNLVNESYKTAKKFSRDKDSFIKSFTTPKRPEFVNEDHLISYRPLRSQLFIHNGFSKATLDYFEIAGGYTDSFGVLRDIIPIRDIEGDLQAYSLKDARRNPPDTSYKYIITEGFIKDSVLYNLHNAKIFGAYLPIIVVEGFKSVWRLYEYGIYNVVCTMGSCITDGQVELLKTYALKGVVIMFDRDGPGEEGAELSGDLLTKYGVAFSILNIKEEDVNIGDGPAELTLQQAYGYLNEFIR